MAGNTAKASSATKRQYRFIRVNPPSKESSCIHHRQGGKKTYFKTLPSLVQTTGGNLLIAQVRVASLDSRTVRVPLRDTLDRKSTRLNSSHGYISYAVFCLKKKKYRFNHIQLIDALFRLSVLSCVALRVS